MASKDKITVLFIIKPEPTAGAEMVLLQSARRLSPERYQVIFGLLTPDAEHLLPADAGVINFNMPVLNGWVWLKFFFKLCVALRRLQVDVIHVNSYVPGNYARLAAAAMRVPVIIDHWHGFTRLNFKRRLICRLLSAFTDLSLVVSPGVRDYLIGQGAVNPGRVRVVANGVDVGRFQQPRPRKEVRRELGLAPETKVVGLVARLDHWGKGHRELFGAMAQIQERRPVHALIVGGGRRQGEMAEVAAGLGIGGAVHFLGNRRDIPDLLNAMDIFVLPSHSEGVSLALLEAMAAGLPVIASAVGGLPEVIAAGVNGVLIPPRDPGALAAALARLLAEPDLARRLGDQARRDVEAHYSLDRLGREINEIYEELVKKGLGVRG
jgi:glycosyltransferase involved in cell wall biosynthesis